MSPVRIAAQAADSSSNRCCRPLCGADAGMRLVDDHNRGQARAKPSRRFSALM